MKILDPQSALLTTAEVSEFLASHQPETLDKSVGAYPSVNLHHLHGVRKDVETYISTVQPYVASYPPTEEFMTLLLRKLKKFDLTKPEILSLINLGAGLSDASDKVKERKTEHTSNGDAGDEASDQEVENGSDLGQSLVKLVIEESDIRFAGEAGEQALEEILSVLRECLEKPALETNGQTKGEKTTDP